ncbi:transporter [Geotalea uraniireducens]|uniref:Transporter n=1 Tax=Geotalea uraniireducens (strain Rf4) TaxID=351605 RepID=A5G701_GEOUR|nr:transporter [Geotalea uraniireducens]ABQ27569.1 hypothetical protein Gura_3413 [Geotalea uraniireducens Rf4]
MNLYFIASSLLLAMLSPTWVYAAEEEKIPTVSVSLGVEFASGKYGTDITTDTVYMPLIVTWFPTARLDVGTEIPFVYQSSSLVTTDIFRASQVNGTAKLVARQGGPGGKGGNHSAASSNGAAEPATSGMGDIILRIGYVALAEGRRAPRIRPSLFVKFPTASERDGLGTGELDAGAGMEVSKWFDDLIVTAEAFYNYQGKAAGLGLKNYVSYTVGTGYQLTDRFRPLLLVRGASEPAEDATDLLELRAKGFYEITRRTGIEMYAAKGITDSSPDYGGGITMYYMF